MHTCMNTDQQNVDILATDPFATPLRRREDTGGGAAGIFGGGAEASGGVCGDGPESGRGGQTADDGTEDQVSGGCGVGWADF